ncbi:MAG: selenium-dependent molybdenum hydroxylase system protein YqeB family [Herbinix sp.]|jgi:selenium-dependent molybdenum hydroxylase system YqeB family protein|nr:selenium-dependent molybdenum hydroxylase system protein YqeB family [Herbinix sp.]
MRDNNLILVRGAGDIATGTIQKLVRAGFLVLATETDFPSAIRRQVALSEAVYEGSWKVEDITGVRVESIMEAYHVMNSGQVAIMIDPSCKLLAQLQPLVVIDAILAKKNLGTKREMAPITIALGPGFVAGEDVNVVIETMRGHNLGRLIFEGSALPNTGVPGMIEGMGRERVIHAPVSGIVRNRAAISDTIEKGQIIAEIDGHPVTSSIDGILRGLIRDGHQVPKGFKIADIDPRDSERENCFTISDKARCIGGSVLEAILLLRKTTSYLF